MKLLEIATEYAALDALLEESGGELTPANEAAFEELFKEIMTNAAEKADGYVNLIKTLERRSIGLKEREEIFATDRRVTDRKAENLRERLKLFGLTTGLLSPSEEIEGSKKKKPGNKIETVPHGFKISVQYAGSAKLIVDEKAEIPDEYLIYEEPKINTKKIREDLTAGKVLPFASFADRSVALIIK